LSPRFSDDWARSIIRRSRKWASERAQEAAQAALGKVLPPDLDRVGAFA
jgi:hypothetical protein